MKRNMILEDINKRSEDFDKLASHIITAITYDTYSTDKSTVEFINEMISLSNDEVMSIASNLNANTNMVHFLLIGDDVRRNANMGFLDKKERNLAVISKIIPIYAIYLLKKYKTGYITTDEHNSINENVTLEMYSDTVIVHHLSKLMNALLIYKDSNICEFRGLIQTYIGLLSSIKFTYIL